MTSVLKVNRQGQVIFQFFWDHLPQKCRKRHHDQLSIIITSLVMNGQVVRSLTSNVKVIFQSHVIYFNIFGFYNLNYIENDTNFITLSHLHQKLSRLTNNGKTVYFDHRHVYMTSWHMSLDICHVTASRWCHICQYVSPTPSNRYVEAIFANGIINKVTGEKRQGVVSPPPPPWASEG